MAQALKTRRNVLRGQIARLYQMVKMGEEVNLEDANTHWSDLMKVEADLLEKEQASADQIRQNEVAMKHIFFIRNQQDYESAAKPKAEPERIPEFTGKYQEFIVFKSVFNGQVGDKEFYSNEYKERKLLTHLKGRALELVTPYIDKKDSYKKMWKALVDEYEEPKQLKEHLKAEVEKMAFLASDFDDKLFEFRDKVLRIKTSVDQNIGKKDEFGNIIYDMIVKKIGFKARAELVRDCENLEEMLEKFQEWLDRKERFVRSGLFNPGRKSRAAAVVTQGCAFCQSEHSTADCKAESTPEKRREVAAQKRLCFICLKFGHRAQDCESNVKCSNCNKEHNVLLCKFTVNKSSRNSAAVVEAYPCVINLEQPVRVAGAAIVESTGENSPYLMAIMNGRRISILLDTGADQTLIKRALCVDIEKGDPLIVDGVGGFKPTSEVAKFYITGEGIAPISFHGYVLDRLPGDIDIIICSSDIKKLLKPENLIDDCAYFDTVFGRVKYGKKLNSQKKSLCAATVTLDDYDRDNLLAKYIEAELNTLSNEEQVTLDVAQGLDGHYASTLPFLPRRRPANNYMHAVKRLEGLIKRLSKVPGLTEKYREKLFAYVKDGHAEEVTFEETPWAGAVFYMPHKEVIKDESETTQFRIVFDASAGQPSLNSCLYKGDAEKLQLLFNLMSFRMNKVAILADAEKAFLQVKIDPIHQDFLRFLWKDGDRIRIFRMTRLPFGLVSSPATLMRTFELQIDKFASQFPEVTKLLKRAFYVDDLVGSVPERETAAKVKEEASMIFKDAGFNLRKWKTNDKELQQEWNVNMEEPATKVLGVGWNMKSDMFFFRFELDLSQGIWTKRKLLALHGSLFDPLGLIEPVKLRIRELTSEIWNLKIGWDVPIPENIQQEIQVIVSELPLLSNVEIPRFLPKPKMLSLFCDASERGYGFVVFISDGEWKNYFVYGKSRIAPLKNKRTMPELELAALTEAVENLPFLCQFYECKDFNIYIWTDSAITLGRLDNNVNKYGTFVGNRLMRIHRICAEFPSTFRYITTKLNPADTYSRPKQVREFLKLQPYKLEYDLRELKEKSERLDLPELSLNSAVETCKQVESFMPGFEHISEWGRLVKCMRATLVAIWKMRKRAGAEPTIEDAINSIYKQVQQQGLSELEKIVYPHFTDENDIIRVRTRNPLDYPVWIPHSSAVAKMIVRNAHIKVLHFKRKSTKALVNETYYIPRLHSLVDKVIRSCVICQRSDKKTIEQPTGDLPHFRVKDYGPFECIGLDYFGPLKLGRQKVWALIVTCSVSRAIHLEIVHDMSADSCLSALNSVFNWRGHPQVIVSDNARTFHRASKELKKLLSNVKQVSNEIIEPIRWYFNPPLSPWWGGWWERLIASVKSALMKINGVANVNQLRYVFTEIMAVLNSRPLFMEDGPQERVITPGHFLIGRSFRAVPYGRGRIHSFKSLDQIRRWRKRFIKFWKSEYLRNLSLHFNSVKNKQEIKVGDIVLVAEDAQQEHWILAKVDSVMPGPDGIVRNVMIRLSDDSLAVDPSKRGPKRAQVVMRTVQKLVKLELDHPESRGPEECRDQYRARSNCARKQSNLAHSEVHKSEQAMEATSSPQPGDVASSLSPDQAGIARIATFEVQVTP